MKLGLIRCLQTEEKCGGVHCFKTIENKEGAFAGITEDIELIGITSCGGCPGNSINNKVKLMVEGGADTIVLASCIKLGTPIDFACPNLEEMKERIYQEAKNIKIIEWTHYSSFKEILLNRLKTMNFSSLSRLFTKGLKV